MLNRSLNLAQATALNMIDMVGIGPFVVMGSMVAATEGPLCLFAWVLGAVLAFADGAVWAELGARWPEAGGSYVFLQQLFRGRMAHLMPFLFTWQTVIQAPLVMASAAIGFSAYFGYLSPLSEAGHRALAGSVVLLMIALLYRDVKTAGRLGLVMGVLTVGTILWIIASGLPHFSAGQAFDFKLPAGKTGFALFLLLGNVSSSAVYSYLGYYNVCHLGGEIRNPQRNIPRAIFISIVCIAVLYLFMQTMLVGVLSTPQLANNSHPVSLYFELLYGKTVAKLATVLVLCIALSSLFSVMLGYSRIPYAAAMNGHFFPLFKKTHPRHHFPHVSLLVLGGIAFVFSLTVKMADIIKAIVVVRIFIQFVSQGIGVILWHRRAPGEERPWKMPLFPLPALVSLLLWVFVFVSSPREYIAGAIVFIDLGLVLYEQIYWRRRGRPQPPLLTT